MNGATPTEQRFEKHIEAQLVASGYSTARHDEYDRALCLIKKQTIEFIQSTQPDEWQQLQTQFGEQTEGKFLGELAKHIALNGIIYALHNKFKLYGAHFYLCYFEPKSGLNPEHRDRYKQNKFTVMRQLHYAVDKEYSIDMALFLNGLPIATLELKNQLTGQSVADAENQYRNDRNPNEPLLKFKRCAVHFCVDNDRVSMTTRLAGKKTRFLPYNKGLENPQVENGYRTHYLWDEVLTPDSLLGILEKFAHVGKAKKLVFDKQKGEIVSRKSEVLVFPRYHQLNLIRRLREKVTEDGSGQSYLIQHTTGAGKSYSIGWLAHLLASLHQTAGAGRLFDTVVVVTDRRVLDDQLGETISTLARTDGVVCRAETSKELREFIEQRKAIIVTTIQKFPFISKKINTILDRKFAVIIDEVHSSHAGELAADLRETLDVTADGDKDADAFDYGEVITAQMKNRQIRQEHISYFGFTGTPKSETLELFGTKMPDGESKPFDTYTMRQSIGEGFTLNVLRNYTTLSRWFQLKQTQAGKDDFPVKKARRELVKYADDHPNTIKYKVNIILNHWISRGSKGIQGQSRAMIVTHSRRHCVKFVREVNRQLEQRGASYRALVGFSDAVEIDGESFTEHGLNEEVGHRGNVPFGLKHPNYRMLVVANKFQTGFDEPLLQCMYVDKHLDGVQCVQTLSRLNRTTEGKAEVFVLDFVNETEDISRSFQQFYKSTILESETDPQSLYRQLMEIESFGLYTRDDAKQFCQLFLAENRDEGKLQPPLNAAVDKFVQIVDIEEQKRFRALVNSYICQYAYLAQIINFADANLEEAYLFLKHLYKKLPKDPGESVKINELVELEYLRIQFKHEQMPPMVDADAKVPPPDFDTVAPTEDERNILAEIIARVNQQFQINFTEDDKAGLTDLRAKLENDTETQECMHGRNTDADKRVVFEEQFRALQRDFLHRHPEFYRKMSNNPQMRDFIRDQLYVNYPK